MSCSNFCPKNPVMMKIVNACCCQSVCDSETFRGETPDCRIRPRSPSSHRRQELVNREPPTLRCVSKSIHSASAAADLRGMFMGHAISSCARAYEASVSCISCPPCRNLDLASAHSNSAWLNAVHCCVSTFPRLDSVGLDSFSSATSGC